MDIILAFVWGMITVIYTLMALVVVQMRKSVKELESQIRDTNETFQDVYRQLEEREGKSVDYTDKLQSKHEVELNELYKNLDSRFDKLENKFKDKLSSGVEVRKALDEIQDLNDRLDRFIRNYQNN